MSLKDNILKTDKKFEVKLKRIVTIWMNCYLMYIWSQHIINLHDHIRENVPNMLFKTLISLILFHMGILS